MKRHFKQCILFYGGRKIFTSSSKNQPSVVTDRRKERIEAEIKEDVNFIIIGILHSFLWKMCFTKKLLPFTANLTVNHYNEMFKGPR